MLRVLNMIVFPLTLLIGVVLSACGLPLYIHPKYSDWLPLLGLLFPFLYALNILLLIYWWVQLKMKLIIPLVFAVFNLIHASKYVQFSRNIKKPDKEIRVATYNTKLLGALENQNTFESLKLKLESDSFDIVCLQEVFAQKDLKARVLELKKAGKFRMYSFFRLEPGRPYGMAVLSKYDIIKSGKIGLGEHTGNMAIYTDVLMGADTVRIYNLHLQSIRFDRGDYRFIEDRSSMTENLEGSKNLIKRIRQAYRIRGNQADSVAAHMANCPYPTLAMGDLNDVPLSYTYQKLMKDKFDAFRERGSGFERTYKGPFPDFRIDYILYSKAFTCTSYRSDGDTKGDHKLVTAGFSSALGPQ